MQLYISMLVTSWAKIMPAQINIQDQYARSSSRAGIKHVDIKPASGDKNDKTTGIRHNHNLATADTIADK
jgi:hypothetical protein